MQYVLARLRGLVSIADGYTVRSKFGVTEVEFQPKPMREQTALFYATAVPLKILMITREQRTT